LNYIFTRDGLIKPLLDTSRRELLNEKTFQVWLQNKDIMDNLFGASLSDAKLKAWSKHRVPKWKRKPALVAKAACAPRQKSNHPPLPRCRQKLTTSTVSNLIDRMGTPDERSLRGRNR